MVTVVPSSDPKNFRVAYPDLGGGRNTRKDSHALNRDQLAVSINGWIPGARSYGKRPGNSLYLTNSTGVGSGATGVDLCVTRFNDISYVLTLSNGAVYSSYAGAASATSIGTGLSTSAKYLNAAQMYDPAPAGVSANAGDCAFLCDGVDVPRIWLGPGHTLTTLPSGSLPLNHAGSALITPAFVCNLLNYLIYSGEPTEPTGVYISDPTKPESFTFGGVLPGNAYQPYLIGHNDGVAGGKITGILPLGNSLMVYKESAIYRMDWVGSYYDAGPWYVTLVSPTVGCTAPKSLVSFDTYHVFLSMDGVYTCTQNGPSPRPISDNNPDLFEGYAAAILDRTSAVGARLGSRYLLFFDNGGL